MHYTTIIDLARKGNKYLQDKEPWKKAGKETTLPGGPGKNRQLFIPLSAAHRQPFDPDQSISSGNSQKNAAHDESGGQDAGLGTCGKN